MYMFIDVRSVVDAGMKYMDRSREEAMQYMRAHLIESEEQIKTENLPYCCEIPGQALAYQSGSFQFERLRKKYQETLVKQFDVIRFHVFILINGCLPFTLPEKALDREFSVVHNLIRVKKNIL